MPSVEYDDIKKIRDYMKGYRASPFPAIICNTDLDVMWSNSVAQTQCPSMTETDSLLNVLGEFSPGQLIEDVKREGSLLLDHIFFLQERRINILPIYFEGEFVAVILLVFHSAELPDVIGGYSSSTPVELIHTIRDTTENIFRALDNLAEKSGIIGMGWVEPHLNRVAWHNSNLLRTATNINAYIALQSGEEQAYTYSLVDIFGWLEDIRRPTESISEGCGITLNFNIPEVECQVLLCPLRFELAFFNIMNNSLRYTAPGGEVAVSAELSPSEVYITIKDNGSGIPHHMLNQIFLPYVTYKQEGAVCGTGLGLTVAKRIITAMKGQISVKSEPGQGSEFMITFPVGSFSHPLYFKQGDTTEPFPRLYDRFTPLYVGLAGLGRESRVDN